MIDSRKEGFSYPQAPHRSFSSGGHNRSEREQHLSGETSTLLNTFDNSVTLRLVRGVSAKDCIQIGKRTHCSFSTFPGGNTRQIKACVC
ncbi:hypothetical protein PO909_007945 [Leuciscus waleckii]